MGKLTCQDLMVGDCVSVSGKSVKITKDDLATMLIFLDDDSKINPIPLTEDILVKNGFVGVELTDSYELNTDYYEIEVWKYSDGLWVVNVHWIEFSSTPDSKATVSYVHQLQHLLRLCGIEKELVID